MATIGIDINQAIRLLKEDKLVAIPTETVYGLAGNALSPKAVASIFSIKKRPTFDPLIIHLPDQRSLKDYVQNIPEQAIKLMETFWPGPLTLILKKTLIIPDLVTSGLETVAVRCPNHPLTLKLLRQLPFPVAAPSANPFGYTSPTTAAHVADKLGSGIPYILDGGACKVGIESTIVGFEKDTTIIYRLGGITEQQLEKAVGSVKLQLSSSNPTAPGQLISHYAPTKNLLVGNIHNLLQTHGEQKLGIISFQQPAQTGKNFKQIVLSDKGNLEEAAANIFSAIREMDAADVELILAEKVPDIGLGKAINDRLLRASS